jgi:hypothetical protein
MRPVAAEGVSCRDRRLQVGRGGENVRAFLTSLCATGVLALGVAGTAGAQPQQGLVNVNIEDNNIVVPINVAANICGVDVDVLVLALLAQRGTQTFDCDATSNQDVTVSG